MGRILFFVRTVCLLLWLPGGVLEQLPSLILVSSQESSACPGGACIGTGSSVGHAPPLTVLLGHLQWQIVLSEPLRIACFYGCREYGWQNQSGANNGNLFRYGRFPLWHFWVDHGFVVFGPNNSHFLRCKQTSITISAILILLSYLHVWSIYTQNGYRWKKIPSDLCAS